MRIRGVVVAGVLALSACTAPVVAPTAPAPVPPSVSTSTAPVPEPPSSAPAPTPDPARPLPASDGGDMLWPVSVAVALNDAGMPATTLYGFVDTAGKLVVPPRYESYQYCPDASGRAVLMIVEAAGRKAEVLDLTGHLQRRLPTGLAGCGPPGFAITTVTINEGDWRNGLVELDSGRVLLPVAKGRVVRVVDAKTVLVWDRDGTALLDVATGARTTLPGVAYDPEWEDGAPGIPAEGPDGRTGFVDRSGAWVHPPEWEGVSGFHSGYAELTLGEERWTFLDPAFRTVGGEWGSIEAVGVDRAGGLEIRGYLVTAPEGEGLLDAGLRVIVEPGVGEIECGDDGLCTVVAPDGAATRVDPGASTSDPLPPGYDQALAAGFLVGTGTRGTRVQAVRTGVVTDLDGTYGCTGVGTAWAQCADPEPAVLPPVVLDLDGRRTPFAGVRALPDPATGEPAFYLATTGRYVGIVDASGAWRYRQSRFTRLED